MDALSEAGRVVIIGMALVFLALGALLVLIIGLERAFRPKEEAVEGPPALDPQAPASAPPAASVAAALAVAIALAQQSTPGAATGRARPASVPSPWSASGRRQQMERRQLRN